MLIIRSFRLHNPFSFQFKSGFTLVELLVVITIFALTVSLITASFTTFEKNSRIKNVSEELQSNIRYVQSKALSGDRSASSLCGLAAGANPAPSTYTLVGWYIRIDPAVNNSYTISGNCQINGTATNVNFDVKTVALPSNVIIASVNSTSTGVNILFRPTGTSVALHTMSLTPPFNGSSLALPFNDSSIDPKPANTWVNQGVLTIRLTSSSASDIYDISVQSTGEVNATKI